MEVIGKNIYEAWIKSLKTAIEFGKDFLDDDKRTCYELRNQLVVIQKPDHLPLRCIDILRSFKKWFYPTQEEITKVILEKDKLPGYSFNYGPRLFNFGNKINQIDDFVIKLLRTKRHSRRAIAVVWNPIEDSNIYSKNIPSPISINFMIRENKLYMTSYIRSSDLFFGMPVNIFQLYSLMKYVKEKLSVNYGDLSVFSFSAHIFKDQFLDIKKVLGNSNQKI